MSTSPDRSGNGGGPEGLGDWKILEAVLRGAGAEDMPAARFDADFTPVVSPTSTPRGEAAFAAARTAGYAEGWAQGQRAARVAAQAAQDQIAAAHRAEESAREALVRQGITALIGAADDLAARTVPAVQHVEDVVLRTALDLAEALLGHELSAGELRDTGALRRALAAAPGSDAVTVRLHPEDHRTLTEMLAGANSFDGRSVALVPDATLRPGDAMAETGATTVDATLSGALQRVRQVLGP